MSLDYVFRCFVIIIITIAIIIASIVITVDSL